jgi:hypothetical protein
MVASVVSVVLRCAAPPGVERQQLKWFTYAAALVRLWSTAPALPTGWPATCHVRAVIALRTGSPRVADPALSAVRHSTG